MTSFPEHRSPEGLEVPEFPRSYVNNLHAEWHKAARERDAARAVVDRLRADLADAQRERDAWQRRAEFFLNRRPITEADIKRGQEIWQIFQAESAGDGGPTEGDSGG